MFLHNLNSSIHKAHRTPRIIIRCICVHICTWIAYSADMNQCVRLRHSSTQSMIYIRMTIRDDIGKRPEWKCIGRSRKRNGIIKMIYDYNCMFSVHVQVQSVMFWLGVNSSSTSQPAWKHKPEPIDGIGNWNDYTHFYTSSMNRMNRVTQIHFQQ